MSRPGFMVYFRDWAALDGLNDAQFRAVFRAAFCYAEDGSENGLDDPMASLAFQMLKPRLDEDAARYEKKVEQTRAAGQRSGEARSNRRQQASTDVNERSEIERTSTDVNVRERTPTNRTNTNTSINTSINSISQERGVIPTVDEVRAYAQSIGLSVDAERFVQHLEVNGGCDSYGQPIRNWHSWLRVYAKLHSEPVKPAIDPGPFF